MIKYILQFSRVNGGGEYLVIVDDKPTEATIKDWSNHDVQLDGVYEADIESVKPWGGRTPNALPTDTVLEAR